MSVGRKDFALYIGSTEVQSDNFVERISRFDNLQINENATGMSDWSCDIPFDTFFEERPFLRVFVVDETDDEVLMAGILEESKSVPDGMTTLSGRGALVVETFDTREFTIEEDEEIHDVVVEYANNFIEFDWTFEEEEDFTFGGKNTATLEEEKTLDGTDYENFVELHTIAGYEFSVSFDEWNDIEIFSFPKGKRKNIPEELRVIDFNRGIDYTNYANKVTLIGKDGINATEKDEEEIERLDQEVHRVVRKPDLETQSEVNASVFGVLAEKINEREQSGSIEAVPTPIDVGYLYEFRRLSSYFVDENFIGDSFAISLRSSAGERQNDGWML